MKKPSFNPRDLIAVRKLCLDGTLPYNPAVAAHFCKIGRIPAVKLAGG